MPDRTPILTGGCQRGAVRYAWYAQPVSGVCHCRICQKAVGGPFAALGTIAVADFSWTHGRPARFRSSSMIERGFCARCGRPLTYQGEDAKMVEVTVCSLDEPGRAAPTHQHGVEACQPWLEDASKVAAHTSRCSLMSPNMQGAPA